MYILIVYTHTHLLKHNINTFKKGQMGLLGTSLLWEQGTDMLYRYTCRQSTKNSICFNFYFFLFPFSHPHLPSSPSHQLLRFCSEKGGLQVISTKQGYELVVRTKQLALYSG